MVQLGSINNVRNVHMANIQRKQEDVQTISKPVESNVSMEGLSAIASYNFAIVNKNKDFEIPVVKMIAIPEDITKLDGEKKFSKSGELLCVITEDGNDKVVYYNDCHKTIQVIDKDTKELKKEQGCYVVDSKEVRVYEYKNDNIAYFTDYDERNGEMVPIGKGKHIDYEDDSRKEFIHYIEDKTYQLIERSDVSEPYAADLSVSYDEEGNIKEINEYDYDEN